MAHAASSRCLAGGDWQRVPARSLASPAVACPAILSRYSWIGTPAERAVECCGGNHRERVISTRRFAACDDASGAPTLASVLRALRDRTVSFVGDSTMHQLWTGLIAELFAAHVAIDVTQRILEYDLRPQNHNRDGMCTVSHKNPPRLGGSENTFRLDARATPTCNHTSYQGGPASDRKWPLRPQCLAIPDLELWLPDERVRFLFFRMDANSSKNVRAAWMRTHAHCGSARSNFADKLDAAVAAGDAVIANIGVWYGAERAAAYRADVDHILSRLQTLAPVGKLGLYRESVVQHFPTASGSGLFEERDNRNAPTGVKAGGRRCQRHCAPLGASFADRHDWRNVVLHELVAERGFPVAQVVPVAALLRPMAALHKSTKWECTLDCTHYCYHPELWAALLDGVYRRLLNWAGSSTWTAPHAPARAGGRGAGGAGGGAGLRRARRKSGVGAARISDS